MNAIALVFLGGGLGASLRYVMVNALFTLTVTAAVWGILLVNVLGSLLMGMALAASSRGLITVGSVQTQLFLLTGVLGGFTTFSAFSADVLHLVQQGHYATAGIYVVGSVVLSLLAVAGGYYLMGGKST